MTILILKKKSNSDICKSYQTQYGRHSAKMESKIYININLDWTIAELEEVFSQAFPFLSLEIYRNGEEINKSFRNFSLRRLAAIRKPQSFSIFEKMTVAELVEVFWESLGIQVAVARKLANSKVETTFTSQWTLEKQNNIGSEVFIEFQKP